MTSVSINSLTQITDRNDLDLDCKYIPRLMNKTNDPAVFCNEIIHVELEDLRMSQAPASYLALPGAVRATDQYGRGVIVDAAAQAAKEDVKNFDPSNPLRGVASPSETSFA